MNQSVQIEGFCTLGRFVDEGPQTIFGDQFVASISDLLSFHRLLTHGPYDYNVARTLGVNYIWDIPSPGNLHLVPARTTRFRLGRLIILQGKFGAEIASRFKVVSPRAKGNAQ